MAVRELGPLGLLQRSLRGVLLSFGIEDLSLRGDVGGFQIARAHARPRRVTELKPVSSRPCLSQEGELHAGLEILGEVNDLTIRTMFSPGKEEAVLYA